MSDIRPDVTQLQSYVYYQDKCFFVSTIERDSSAAACPMRYAETIVWEYDRATATRGKILDMDGSGPALLQHTAIIKAYYEHGERKQDEG
jgi:hypothetical protein